MSSPSIKSEPVPESNKEKAPPSPYVESVKMTPQRLMNAVINNKNRQGGSSEH